ncbi:MAG: serine hydroxymethyltransferase [Candidatus Niyogibacteria bacterium]|nr:serine hydroxymethyltransferase [Candidatus Niyogibacteria bacterium]
MNEKVVLKLIRAEERRQAGVINLIASENYVSRAVRAASGSIFTNKYSEGYPGKRYYAGNEIVDEVERLAQERALKLFGLNPKKWGVNVQALSGVPANVFVYSALVKNGDLMAAQALDQGGHLSHGSPVSLTSRFWKWVHYGVSKETETLDYDGITALLEKEFPKLIVAGFSSYPRRLDFKRFRTIADACGAYLMADIAHVAGLVAARAYPSPFPYADVVTMTTHKTLRGPRGALIFFKKELEEKINKAVFPGGQGGPHNHQTAAIAVALAEAKSPAFKKYARQTVANARVLAQELQKKRWRIVSGGTDNHLMLVDVSREGLSGKDAEKLLESAGIIVNRNAIPFDARPPYNPSGIRIGTPAVTTRGMKGGDMKRIAEWLDGVLRRALEPAVVKAEIRRFIKKFPLP